jgi:hypothetical protein
VVRVHPAVPDNSAISTNYENWGLDSKSAQFERTRSGPRRTRFFAWRSRLTSVPKRRHIIALAKIPAAFDDPCIRMLAAVAKLPEGADLEAFGWWIREAAEMFVGEVQVLTANEVRSEIAALHKAAARRDFEQAASLLSSLSQEARALFEQPPLALAIEAYSRCASRAENVLSLKASEPSLPSPSDLRNDASRDKACATIESVCRIGGQLVKGRRRPLGKRSNASVRPYFYAPSAMRNFPKREAERQFVQRLSIAWRKGTGKEPPRTARRAGPDRDIGPFPRLVRECLRLVGASYADPVALINCAVCDGADCELSTNNP